VNNTASVFINYRTGDEETAAALIERDLSGRFGPEQIFRDSKSIRPGEDFEQAILMAVRGSDVLLAVIGRRWLTAPDGHGGRALDHESDWTRREICEAFACGVRVIPVLVGGVGRLRADTLPPALQQLARCQYLRLDHRNVDVGLDRLTTTLVDLVPRLSGLGRAGTTQPIGIMSIWARPRMFTWGDFTQNVTFSN
jgi:hypothetical protein